MSNANPYFSEQSAPLFPIIETAYEKIGRRTKHAIAEVTVKHLGWVMKQSQAFKRLREQLQRVAESVHRNTNQTGCVHSDASEIFWAADVSQCDEDELKNPTTVQGHQPLAFFKIPFNNTHNHWTTYEKEEFAVVPTFRRSRYMMRFSDPIYVFNDHCNLSFIFILPQ